MPTTTGPLRPPNVEGMQLCIVQEGGGYWSPLFPDYPDYILVSGYDVDSGVDPMFFLDYIS